MQTAVIENTIDTGSAIRIKKERHAGAPARAAWNKSTAAAPAQNIIPSYGLLFARIEDPTAIHSASRTRRARCILPSAPNTKLPPIAATAPPQ